MDCFPVIVCIAKKEHDYIEEFVKYHLALGFKRIYLYDNEDDPTYEKLLHKYNDHVVVEHLPYNNYNIAVQYKALSKFVGGKMQLAKEISHVIHIDIDEFIVLKKHSNICEFINEYIVNDTAGIGINWRFFGSSGRTEKTNDPVTMRFTMCQNGGDHHIKTLFKKDCFLRYNTCHDIICRNGYIKSTNGFIIQGPFNKSIDLSVIQLNHYKCKTLPEFRYIRTRQRADIKGDINEDVDGQFKLYDINEVQDLTASNFYKKHFA